MTPTADPLLARGISAAKAGDRSLARQLLSQAVRQNPKSEPAWLWLSGVLDTAQGRAYCLRQVLELNPGNELAQRGLAALLEAKRGPVLVARPIPPPPAGPKAARAPATQTPAPAVTPSAPVRRPRARRTRRTRASRQRRFWQVTIAVLGIVALSLVGTLAFAMLGRPTVSGDDLLAVADIPLSPAETPTPHGTLRPTFTATPTDTPTSTPTATLVPTLTPLPTDTPPPTDTPLPTDTPTQPPPPMSVPSDTPRPRIRSIAATATKPPAPRPPLPSCSWDSRLDSLGVRVERASAGPDQPFWRLVAARWANERESAGRHTIFIEVLDAGGTRAVGQSVIAQWAGGSVTLPVENPPAPDWPANFAMFNTLGSYAVSIGGAPSDRVVGMGLGTAEAPDFTIHTSFYLTFQLVRR